MGFDPWALKQHRKYPHAFSRPTDRQLFSRPTDRQLAYIESLCDDLELEHSNYTPDSFIEASEMIDDLKFEAGL